MTVEPRLDCDVREDALVVRPIGDIDLANAGLVREGVLALIERHECRCLVLDLSEVDYLDSSGIELLFRLSQALGGTGQDLSVVAPEGSRAARVLRLVALDDVGDVRTSLDDALDACRRARQS
jgi:anti-anti-sigma factor